MGSNCCDGIDFANAYWRSVCCKYPGYGKSGSASKILIIGILLRLTLRIPRAWLHSSFFKSSSYSTLLSCCISPLGLPINGSFGFALVSRDEQFLTWKGKFAIFFNPFVNHFFNFLTVVIGLIITFTTIVLAGICQHNFGRGLKTVVQKKPKNEHDGIKELHALEAQDTWKIDDWL